MDEIAVLVLNYSFEPLHFTNGRRGLPSLQPQEGKSPPRRGGHATAPRAGASQVRVLDAHAQAPARAFADRFLAQVSRGGRRPGVLGRQCFGSPRSFRPAATSHAPSSASPSW